MNITLNFTKYLVHRPLNFRIKMYWVNNLAIVS